MAELDPPNILRSLEEDPRNWMLKLPGLTPRPSLGLRVPGGSAPVTTPPFLPNTGLPGPQQAQPPRLTPGISLSAPPVTAPPPTSLSDPNAPKGLNLPTPPDPNDPKLQGPHGAKRVFLTLGASMLGGPVGEMATRALHPYEAAEQRYRQQLADADTASQIADRQRTANLPASRLPIERATPGEAVRDPNLPNAQWEVPAPAKPEPLIRLGPGDEAVEPGTGKVIASVPGKPVAQNFEEQEYNEWKAAQKAGADTSRMAFEKARKTATEMLEKPGAEDKAISDHLAAQGLPNTPTNRDKARIDLTTGKVTAAAEAKGTEQQAQLRQSAQAGLKNMQALKDQNTDPANYAYLMNFIGMSYEGIKGARLNRAEIERAAVTRSLPDQLQHAYDVYIQKRILTPQQKKEMLDTATALAGTYNQAGATVMMKAPNGQTKPVPADQVEHYKSLGAVPVTQ